MNNQKCEIIISDDRFCGVNTLFSADDIIGKKVFHTDLLKNILKNMFANFRIVWYNCKGAESYINILTFCKEIENEF